ncbi:hypothetical protein COU00_03550 [Candidatus Falkowbacteria bacterium CG10_big_fil_rev_8_21_14_0_10_43_11]|uniref:Uncharacterized protein n=1 Tax=Candidatus Falkowbacteria bacterium CG10_big_fil_rev_8_21_14_0_10_43_11 TaxID=1974568 RepID=A0A2M6WLA0_9BACT|nr:MAG: hypothetical protein COU00_03550 [Candidatus Falkowbacteria bacterium CG10_big_fil_rev_8_21_14_0_10_43_11]
MIIEQTFLSKPKQYPSFKDVKVKSGAVAALYKKRGFNTQPPKPGSIAEERLINACKKYIPYVIADDASSEKNRRQFHNELGLMIMGQERSHLNNYDADRLADFAFELITGSPMRTFMAGLEEKKG